MPNWCQNNLTVSHSDPLMVQKFVEACKSNGLFGAFLPTPVELTGMFSPVSDPNIAVKNIKKYGSSDWYDWNVNNWGTKWDVNEPDHEVTNETVTTWFDTAWGPPLAFYEHLKELGYTVEAMYNESGMGFAGVWTDEFGDEYVEYDFTDENWDEGLSEDLKDMLMPEYENWLSWQEEEDKE
jgi:hypothetical protein